MAYPSFSPRFPLAWPATLMGLLACSLIASGTAVALLATATWMMALYGVRRSAPGGTLSIPFLYLVLLGIFHLGLVVPVRLGAAVPRTAGWLESPFVDPSLQLFSAATASYAIGARRWYTPHSHSPNANMVPARRLHFLVGLGVAVVGAGLLWTGVIQLGLLTVAYGEYWEQALSSDVRLLGFGMMLFPIGLLLAAYWASARQMYALGGMVVVVFGPLFLMGFRGHAIAHSLALLTVWVRKDARVARRLATIGGATLLVLVPAVRITRNLNESFSDALADSRPIDFLLEAGASLRPLVVTTEAIDTRSERLWLGRSYALAASRIVPNVSLSARDRGGLERDPSPSSWATMVADPWVYQRGGGIGYSGVAEPYLNFWWPGLILFFLCLGYVMRMCDGWLSSDPRWGPLALATSGFVFLTVRNDVMGIARAVALTALIIALIRMIARSVSRSRQHRPPTIVTPDVR
jgi:oligosaccharide repeat unit polymerase